MSISGLRLHKHLASFMNVGGDGQHFGTIGYGFTGTWPIGSQRARVCSYSLFVQAEEGEASVPATALSQIRRAMGAVNFANSSPTLVPPAVSVDCAASSVRAARVVSICMPRQGKLASEAVIHKNEGRTGTYDQFFNCQFAGFDR